MKPKKSVQEMKPYNPPLEGRRDFVRFDFNEKKDPKERSAFWTIFSNRNLYGNVLGRRDD